MKTHRYLWPQIVSFENLLEAHRRAAHGKRLRPNVAEFSFDLEAQLTDLQRELRGGCHIPGPYRRFWVYDRKPRLISAAPFRDRVVHHALCNIIEPIFEAGFIHDSYASRKGKGTHAAVDRYTHFARRHPYVLTADIERYFPSIDHETLLASLGRRLACRRTLGLCRVIIEHGAMDGSPLGLPIGNQTSQFFANVHLDPVDHFMLEQVRPAGYIRYVDDICVFADTKRELWEAADALRAVLAERGLSLPLRRCQVRPVTAGVTFLGFRLWPHHRRLKPDGVLRFARRYRRLVAGVREGTVPVETLRAAVAGWLGHARHADTDALVAHILRY